mgnify:FL=1
MKGVTHYRLNYDAKTIDVVKKYGGKEVGLLGSFKYIVDLSLTFYKDEGLILVLDAELGLI